MGITAPEYWEYRRRKSAAEAEMFVGFILFFLSIIGGVFSLFSGNLGLAVLCILLFLGALVLFWDSNEKLEKIKHIYWTKQAMREYEETKYKAIGEALRKELPPPPPPPPSTDTQPRKIYCVYCGAENSTEDIFCQKCGKKIVKPI